jgi:hypothetical protein
MQWFLASQFRLMSAGHPQRFRRKSRDVVARFWHIFGISSIAALTVSVIGCNEEDYLSPSSNKIDANERCVPYVELLSASDVASELGRSETWVLSNYRVHLFSKTRAEGKGRAVGEMISGSRARIIDRRGGDYFVESPLDGSQGWISSIQVAGEVLQDPDTNELCGAGGGSASEVECPDGSVYYGNDPDRACR